MKVAVWVPNVGKGMSTLTSWTPSTSKPSKYSSPSTLPLIQQPQDLHSHPIKTRQKGLHQKITGQPDLPSVKDRGVPVPQPTPDDPIPRHLEQIRGSDSSQLNCQQSLPG